MSLPLGLAIDGEGGFAVMWLPDHPEALASVARSAVTSQASMGVRGFVAVASAFLGLS
jgi:hypothetical protein